MSNVKKPTDQNSEDVYSLEEIIKIFYLSGVNTFDLWENLLENIKTLVAEDAGLAIFSLHEKLSFIIKSYKDNLLSEIDSQSKAIQLQKYVFSIDEILNCKKPLKEINKIIQQAGKNIASTAGVIKEIKKSYRNKPY